MVRKLLRKTKANSGHILERNKSMKRESLYDVFWIAWSENPPYQHQMSAKLTPRQYKRFKDLRVRGLQYGYDYVEREAKKRGRLYNNGAQIQNQCS